MSSRAAPPSVKCPTCGTPVAWVATNPHRPFCCARCRQIDLGQWASDAYRVPGAAADADLDPLPPAGN